MSTPEKNGLNSQETEGKVESNLAEPITEEETEENELPSKSTLSGSDMKPSTPLASAGESSDSNLPENSGNHLKSLDSTQNFEEIGSGDNDLSNPVEEATKALADDSRDTINNTTSSPKPESNKKNIVIIDSGVKSFSFLEPGMNLAGDDQDRESQDEDLVLKWDDDDLDNADVSIAGDEPNHNITEGNDNLTTQVEKIAEPKLLGSNITELKANLNEPSVVVCTLQVPPNTDTVPDQLDQHKDFVSADVSLEPSTNAVGEGIDQVTNSAVQNADAKSIVEAISHIIDQDHTNNENVILNENRESPAASVDMENKLVETINVDGKHNDFNVKTSELVTKTNSTDPSQPVLSNNEGKSIAESEKSNQESEEAQESADLLFEIDAQIAKLDASLSKAENEKDTTEKSDGSTEELKNNVNFRKDDTVVEDDQNLASKDVKQTEVIVKETDIPVTAIDVKMVDDKKIATVKDNSTSPDTIVQTSSAINALTDKHISISNDTFKTQETQIGIVQEIVSENPNNDIISEVATSADIFEAETVANSTAIQNNSMADANIESTSTINYNNLSQDSLAVIEPIVHGLKEPNMMLEIPTQELIDMDESVNMTESDDMIVDDESKPDISLKDFIKDNQPDSKSLDVVDKISTENVLDSDVKMIDEVSKAVECFVQTESVEPISSMEIDIEQDINFANKESVTLENSIEKDHDNQSENIEEEPAEKKLASQLKNIEERPTKINLDSHSENIAEKSTEMSLENQSVNVDERSIETDLGSQLENIEQRPTEQNLNSQSERLDGKLESIEKRPTEKNLHNQSNNIEERSTEMTVDNKSSNIEETPAKTNLDSQSENIADGPAEITLDNNSQNIVERPTDIKLDKQSENVIEASIILPAESTKEIEQVPKNAEVKQTPSDEQQLALEAQVIVKPSIMELSTTSEDLSKPDKVVGESLEDVAVPSKPQEPLKGDQEKDTKLNSPEDIMDVQPSTSKEPNVQPSSSTQMAPDSSDDDVEVTDSLGLLAECSRVAEDDDEQETSDHEEDDDDFDPDADESSNQLGPELSEDSAQHSETDAPKRGEGGGEGSATQGFAKGLQPSSMFDLLLTDKAPPGAQPSPPDAEGNNDADMDVDDDIVCEEMDVTSGNLIGDADPAVDEALDATLDAALDATLEPETPLETLKIPIEQGTQVEAAGSTDSKTDDGATRKAHRSTLRALLLDGSTEKPVEEDSKLPISSKTGTDEAFVDLRESSSEDDNQEILKTKVAAEVKEKTPAVVDPRINTSEISIKTTSAPKALIVIPEAKISEPSKDKGTLEVFNVDSDDEVLPTDPAVETDKVVNKCINSACASTAAEVYVAADCSARMFYQCKRRGYICLPCLHAVHCATQKLVEGIKKCTPLLELEVREREQECVEISDSDSDDEADAVSLGDREKIMEPAILERQLANVINATWDKYKFERLLNDAQDHFVKEIERIEEESSEVNAMLDECQAATDRLRNELYASFAVERRTLPALTIYDAPDRQYSCLEAQSEVIKDATSTKRRLSDSVESKAKRPIPPGYTTAPAETQVKTESPKQMESSKLDDDKDVSVVRLSAEQPPPSLPPPGEPVRPPLTPATPVYAMRHAFGSWIRARVLDVTPKGNAPTSQHFTMCRVKFDNKTNRNATKVLPARCLAYCHPSDVRMTIGTRVIALFKAISSDEKEPKRESFYSGIVAEIPNPVNKYRYLVFFDDGYAQYVQHADTRLVCEFSSLVWEEVHSFSREFVKEYLLAYPERPMVRLHTGQNLKTEWNGKWWTSRVIAVDASLVQVYFEQDKRTEWIYRGSTRLAPLYLELQAAEKHRARPLPRNRQNKLNMPYVEYTRTDEAEQTAAEAPQLGPVQAEQEEIRRQRAVAKKSTGGAGVAPPAAAPPPRPPPAPAPAPGLPHSDAAPYTSRVVYYTPKNAVKPHLLVPHACGPRCRRTDVLSLKDLRTYNPLAKPLLSGWERQIARFKGHREVAYRAPCGRRIRTMRELHRYLRLINSDMGVDLFDFGPSTHCLAEFVLNKCIVGKKDLSHGKENVPVPCVNYYDDSLPEFCSYNTERTPTNGVPLNLDPAFLCGCDCTDDCQDKSKCACWKLTLEGARTIGLEGDVGYDYKRLLEPLPSGIYECNVRCKCKSTCLNRVAQHPLQLKLQVFKTANRGWGIRALNDVPKGSFLCIYAGNLLTDATANLDGLNEGDEYLAELDYIEVVEQMKEGYEDDIPDADKKLDKKDQGKQSETESEPSESEEEEGNSKSDEADGDFEPAYIPGAFGEFSKRLRKREKKKKKDEEDVKEKDGSKEGKENAEEDCITISDDEEIREPSRFAAQAGMGEKYISKYRSVRSYFGKDEACYIMDAKVQGNIGRYLNHSCSPNVFVQNVFVDTHDPRFPWVAFFALTHIRAGTELTWNYNYDVGSVPGKALYCYCGAANCRGRLL